MTPQKRDYAKLWLASGTSALGDGVTLAAGPLLMATLTDDPALIAGAVFAQQLPWLLFSLLSGALVDRVDRRIVVAVVDAVRGVVIGALALLAWNDLLSVPAVYGAVFLMGLGSTLADNASQALVPSVVPPEDLAKANAWLSGARMLCSQFAGPPLGGWLFAAAAALPFGVDAATFLLAAGFVFSIRPRARDEQPTADTGPDRSSIRRDIAEGFRWLWNHRALRLLALVVGLMNLTFGGAFAAYVLYARERLGLTEVGYGFLLSATAVGGVVGTLSAARLDARFGAAPLLRAGLLVETCSHLVFAVTRSPWVAAVTLVVFGAHATVWGVVADTYRQRATPAGLLGRVNSVHLLFSMGGLALGSLVGGVVAKTFGIVAPFWVGFGAMAVVVVLAWGAMTPSVFASRAAEEEPAPPKAPFPS
ncbi:MFS transporter [Streptomyces sp. MNP-20]|uniref:MFS transporter n=1 Tax=Streptomyces sp. MNP-20 TaxID=2721165 RepID=UPI001551D34E|nr:MFS transporter [Streptomyces sp. MNP-20]